jgi:hypothetical protein
MVNKLNLITAYFQNPLGKKANIWFIKKQSLILDSI